MPEEERHRMAKNLYNLLRLSTLLPPECQLHSGMVQWSGEVPIEGDRDVDMYKGRYLQSEDVRIKVIRTVNMKDTNTVKVCRRVESYQVATQNTFRGYGVRLSYGGRFMRLMRESISHHSMDSTALMAFVCEYPRQRRFRPAS